MLPPPSPPPPATSVSHRVDIAARYHHTIHTLWSVLSMYISIFYLINRDYGTIFLTVAFRLREVLTDVVKRLKNTVRELDTNVDRP
jgi:hypothetical protein